MDISKRENVIVSLLLSIARWLYLVAGHVGLVGRGQLIEKIGRYVGRIRCIHHVRWRYVATTAAAVHWQVKIVAAVWHVRVVAVVVVDCVVAVALLLVETGSGGRQHGIVVYLVLVVVVVQVLLQNKSQTNEKLYTEMKKHFGYHINEMWSVVTVRAVEGAELRLTHQIGDRVVEIVEADGSGGRCGGRLYLLTLRCVHLIHGENGCGRNAAATTTPAATAAAAAAGLLLCYDVGVVAAGRLLLLLLLLASWLERTEISIWHHHYAKWALWGALFRCSFYVLSLYMSRLLAILVVE